MCRLYGLHASHPTTPSSERSVAAIQGDTDSEHVFHLLMSRLAVRERSAMVETLAQTAHDLERWCDEEGADLALNVIWAIGEELAGTRLGRSLHAVRREQAHVCAVCGRRHGPEDADDYRAVVIASERVTDETWVSVDERTVWSIDEQFDLCAQSL